MATFLENAGPEGMVFFALLGALLLVWALRCIQSTVQKIDARVYPLVSLFAVLLIVVIVNLAREDSSTTEGQEHRMRPAADHA